MVEVVEYNPEWINDFEGLKKIYLDAVKDVNVRIEHIGSTSIPNLWAKPIIDIAVVHYKKSDFDIIKKSLEAIGYVHRGDLGITNREAFGYKGKKQLPKHHLYVCLDGILALRNQTLFRDYLKENEDAVLEYGRLKKELAQKYDIDKYCYRKTEFIIGILKKCGLSQTELDEIIKMNEI